MGNPLVPFEFAGDDPEALAEFYRGLFDWKVEKWGEGEMEYWMIETGSRPEGGLMRREHPGQTTLMYFDVASIDEDAAKAEELGGKVLAPKTAVADMGWFAVIADPQGSTFGIWETNPDYRMPEQ